jgi:conserved oligomeric Golgi complex subunit 5
VASLKPSDTATHSTSDAEIPLRALNVVSAHVPFIEDARVRVTGEMESMVLTGLTTLVRDKTNLPV